MLERAGFTVLTAENGRQAVEVYRQEGDRIDVVVLDLSMPELDGLETLEQLRRIDPGVRVVLLSGHPRQAIEEQLADANLIGYVRKPYQINSLVRLLAGVLVE